MLAARPDDFSVEYTWSAGSLPPPGHFEYRIQIQPTGAGLLTYWPDYPGFPGVPEWRESFSLSPEQLDQLYRVMLAQGLFSERWEAQADPPLGGNSQWLTLTAHQRQIEIQAFLMEAPAAKAAAIYTALRACVPATIWGKLEKQRLEYIQAYRP